MASIWQSDQAQLLWPGEEPFQSVQLDRNDG